MRAAVRSALFAVICGVIGASNAWAIPITWEASGVLNYVIVSSPPGDPLEGIHVGTEWTLELTFDSESPGTLAHPGTSPTYVYQDAVSARFRLGEYDYTNPNGDIFINADLPVIGHSTSLGGPGLVQFQFLDGWLGGAGGPDLNFGIGLLLLSYNDLNAIDGSLPSVPNRAPNQSALGGLMWGLNYSQFGSSSFNPVPVPEPASMLLVGTGLALIAARLRKRKRSA